MAADLESSAQRPTSPSAVPGGSTEFGQVNLWTSPPPMSQGVVLPALSALFDVVAIDLPGFGESEQLPTQIEPMPAALAGMVAALLDKLEITGPHLVGNSLGAWVALETAKIRPVRSVTLLSPAGLWRGGTPVYCRVSLAAVAMARTARRAAVVAPRALSPRACPGPRPDSRPPDPDLH
jgi:pimeloyl-ACP methyl ester carboxylesterase